MVSNKLIVAAFAALASVANASPCKPSSTKAITTSATETASAGFTSKTSTSVETSTAITESGTVIENETAATATDATTEALSTEASTTVSESATTTATVDEPLLTNTGFEDGTTAPWQLLTQHEDSLVLGSGYQSPASGKVQFGDEDGSQYSNLIIQKINKKALQAGSYVLEGRTRVDEYSQSGDGCSTIIAACLTGGTGSWVPVPASLSRASAETSVGHWSQIDTTCTFTEEMLSADADISVVFGFYCANSGAYLDSVELKPAAVIPNTDTTTVATNSETSMIITTTQATTMATSIEGSTIATETATTTTATDADPTPLLINGSFDLDTTEPWLSTRSESVDRDTNSPFEGPASGRLVFGVDGGQAYNNYFYQKIDTKDLKAASYRLSGFVRVDYYTNSINGDGCNSMAVGCTLGDPNNLDRVPGSTVMGTPSVAVDNWFPLDTTCTLTEEMLSQHDYVSVTFGFSCAEVGANLDAVTFQEVV
ncbi:hypothetical protein BFJ63_vAg13244 [Fusarium oxysporum f. sp. narcissi]|uniref:CBM-cenC domain-containing protein n=3 Tax=Fusarium oxysporum TaxID=5507 RepID=A0A4Q2VF12_FUSOX|nr:uncharacterized protein FOBCDRAFT_154845 [Fusarium oxysporum Fo47]KAJ4121814.1 hypothetical protein NW765_004639 [Fusarium oxysporum]RKK25263.1 hypothetical protein BFJ65_g3170 [Fusarium oxysporum f. sp. cepae]RYC83859.1 hypothetical protein BFJ63_vAg13244 [Fusarium oxysporum f. sp. narcissi]EWZ47350.1 hypothetical protein FOZG_03287 [Fusarium oxysporum Fo47]KAJ4275086.1 hypothetical protein NW764_010597 [Fusarium oxysporum]